MLTNQALSEVLQLVASQLLTLQAVVFACFRPVTKNRKVGPANGGDRQSWPDGEPKRSPASVAEENNADGALDARSHEW
jgi:hypothetical protein